MDCVDSRFSPIPVMPPQHNLSPPPTMRKFPDLSAFVVPRTHQQGNQSMEVQTLPPFPVDSVGLKDGVGRSSNSYPHGNTKQAARIPLPDQSAFESDRYMNSSPPSIPKMCPPTPARTPAWAQKGLGPPTRLVRRSSLNCTKILLELPVFQGTPDGKFKFQEEYVNLGKIGMGTFSEVFCVRSRSDQQMYAIKKSKRKFLSKRDRALFMFRRLRISKGLGHTVTTLSTTTAPGKRMHTSTSRWNSVRGEISRIFCRLLLQREL